MQLLTAADTLFQTMSKDFAPALAHSANGKTVLAAPPHQFNIQFDDGSYIPSDTEWAVIKDFCGILITEAANRACQKLDIPNVLALSSHGDKPWQMQARIATDKLLPGQKPVLPVQEIMSELEQIEKFLFSDWTEVSLKGADGAYVFKPFKDEQEAKRALAYLSDLASAHHIELNIRHPLLPGRALDEKGVILEKEALIALADKENTLECTIKNANESTAVPLEKTSIIPVITSQVFDDARTVIGHPPSADILNQALKLVNAVWEHLRNDHETAEAFVQEHWADFNRYRPLFLYTTALNRVAERHGITLDKAGYEQVSAKQAELRTELKQMAEELGRGWKEDSKGATRFLSGKKEDAERLSEVVKSFALSMIASYEDIPHLIYATVFDDQTYKDVSISPELYNCIQTQIGRAK